MMIAIKQLLDIKVLTKSRGKKNDKYIIHTFWTVSANGRFDQLPIGKISHYNSTLNIYKTIYTTQFKYLVSNYTL